MNSIFKNDDMQTSVKFANGEYVVSKKQLPWKVKAVEMLFHGDVKTVAVEDSFVIIEEGEEVQLVDIWNNFYGMWARTLRDDGEYVDVRPKGLEVVSV